MHSMSRSSRGRHQRASSIRLAVEGDSLHAAGLQGKSTAQATMRLLNALRLRTEAQKRAQNKHGV